MDADLVRKLIRKLDYSALLSVSRQIREQQQEQLSIPELPTEIPSKDEELDEELIGNLHRVLFDVHVVMGNLVCPDTGRKFPIKEGIPNMILHEDEL